MKKRKVFHSIIRKDGIVGLREQDGFEVEVDGEKFNAYRNTESDRAYIIDPKTGLALLIHDCTATELTDIDAVEAASAELAEDAERLKKWREWKSKESHKLAVEMFAAYEHAEELREKQNTARQREIFLGKLE